MMGELLKAWDGVDREEAVVEILSYAPLIEFEGKYLSRELLSDSR